MPLNQGKILTKIYNAGTSKITLLKGFCYIKALYNDLLPYKHMAKLLRKVDGNH